jgi:hypothetical protein
VIISTETKAAILSVRTACNRQCDHHGTTTWQGWFRRVYKRGPLAIALFRNIQIRKDVVVASCDRSGESGQDEK